MKYTAKIELIEEIVLRSICEDHLDPLDLTKQQFSRPCGLSPFSVVVLFFFFIVVSYVFNDIFKVGRRYMADNKTLNSTSRYKKHDILKQINRE